MDHCMKVLSVLPETSSPIGMIFSYRQIRSLEKLGVVNHTFLIPSKGLTFSVMIKIVAALRSAVKEHKPDLVHVHYGAAYAFIAALSGCFPLLITFHGSDLNKVKTMAPWKNIVKVILSNCAVLRAKRVICVSGGVRKKLWWRRKIAQIVPLGTDTEEFCPADRKEARKKLGWGGTEKIVLFNANDPVIKRLDIAEKAIEMVKQVFPGARLEVLSGKDDNRNLVPVLLNASDCLLICSDSEGSPMMVKEALACNVPVVGVDVGDVKERLEGVWPSKVAAKEPSALAESIVEILREGSPSNGREKLNADQLSEESVAQKVRKIYSVVSGK
jgi:teichuronic acid biosynthesis glycosyltransferase TuaC